MLDHFDPRYVHQDWWPGILGWVIPVLFLIALIGFGVWAVRRLSDRGGMPAFAGAPAMARASDGALRELRLRYARGEIGRDEFIERSRDLGDEGPEPVPPSPPEAA